MAAGVCLRTCVGCRAIVPADELSRLVLVGGRLVCWSRASARARAQDRPPGRGASIHPRDACVTKALRSGAFARVFRARVDSVEPGELLQLLKAATVRETP